MREKLKNAFGKKKQPKVPDLPEMSESYSDTQSDESPRSSEFSRVDERSFEVKFKELNEKYGLRTVNRAYEDMKAEEKNSGSDSDESHIKQRRFQLAAQDIGERAYHALKSIIKECSDKDMVRQAEKFQLLTRIQSEYESMVNKEKNMSTLPSSRNQSNSPRGPKR